MLIAVVYMSQIFIFLYDDNPLNKTTDHETLIIFAGDLEEGIPG